MGLLLKEVDEPEPEIVYRPVNVVLLNLFYEALLREEHIPVVQQKRPRYPDFKLFGVSLLQVELVNDVANVTEVQDVQEQAYRVVCRFEEVRIVSEMHLRYVEIV